MTVPPDTSVVSQNLSLPIYRGRAYHGYPANYKGDPTFLGLPFTSGSLNYRGVEYRNVLLTYDAYLERLVINHPELLYPAQLEPAWISHFSIGEHRFEQFSDQQMKIEGALEVLVDGNDVRLLVEHRRLLRKEASQSELLRSFEPETRYFLQWQGEMYEIERKGDLYNAAPEFKKALKSYYKENDLSFKRQRRESLRKLVAQLQKLMQSR